MQESIKMENLPARIKWEKLRHTIENMVRSGRTKEDLITTQAKRNLSSRSGIGGVLSAT